MESIIQYIIRWFSSMFRSSAYRHQRRLEAGVRRATIGKVQARVAKASQNMDRKLNKAQDKVLPGGKKSPPK